MASPAVSYYGDGRNGALAPDDASLAVSDPSSPVDDGAPQGNNDKAVAIINAAGQWGTVITALALNRPAPVAPSQQGKGIQLAATANQHNHTQVLLLGAAVVLALVLVFHHYNNA